MENQVSFTPTELLKLPREQRDAVLSASAALAEELYRTDKYLAGFDAFSWTAPLFSIKGT